MPFALVNSRFRITLVQGLRHLGLSLSNNCSVGMQTLSKERSVEFLGKMCSQNVTLQVTSIRETWTLAGNFLSPVQN